MSKQTRAPIVTVLGHVDHGKTSLLDKIRDTRLQTKEAGGITQSIGAYQVLYQDSPITFIDTPGHEAFSKMRARGGQVADIVLLVIAADDGVQPQTVEAIDHAKAAQSKVIVVLNKMDLPGADPEKVKNQLTRHEILVRGHGGETPIVETSAETGEGLDQLLDEIINLAQTLDLSADPNNPGAGVVIEAYLDKRRGPIANTVVTNGTLHVKNTIVAGSTYGRIKSLTNWQGESIKEAGPGEPTEILGLNEVPEVGVQLVVREDRAQAQKLAKKRQEQQQTFQHITPEERVRKALLERDKKEIALILKANSQGSLEAVTEAIENLATNNISVKILHQGVGEINESDVLLAVPVQGLVLGFGVGTDRRAEKLAQREGVIQRNYQVIYRLLEELQEIIQGEEKASQIKVIGKARVKQLFELSDGSIVAGCEVQEGSVHKGYLTRVIREDKVIDEKKISSLKIRQKDVSTVKAGNDCGIILGQGAKDLLQKDDLLEIIQK